MLDRFEESARDESTVSVEKLMDAVGRRSFGPLILFAGVVLTVPGVADIPGVSTLIGIYVLLVAGQLICGRRRFWLPRWLLDRSTKSGTITKAASNKWMRKLSKFVDKMVTERLGAFVGNRGTVAVAVACCILALATPLTEFVPFSGTGVGAAIGIFGIALVAQDGLMAILGFTVTAVTLVAAITMAG
ncbi:exopolysaccharide biosynthesis protein [Luteolibacter yonseiensis]|uniref:Exopolysaccharide biosynthesis protein n=1 Tax=Luteolibacter yonseiensis TaxID=1144680 RepID=A0A934R726_9BACT|nr:exopolysaccharide biosynthesis protein [Luteolibacter yonseiensis]MBK1818217.1 exopolysaccharide biosynthesis protein [Luteolibacter yonseiensis]